jgi:hypothetical protein
MRAATVALVFVAACAAPSSSSSSDAAADLALPAASDLATSDLAGVVCGNGDCEPGENGASCGSDCCDAMTSCDASRGNGGAFFCRSMNGGAFAWYSQNDTEALCDDVSQIGVTAWACAARSGHCCSLPGGYVDGPCP